jgi:hypothetical protein
MRTSAGFSQIGNDYRERTAIFEPASPPSPTPDGRETTLTASNFNCSLDLRRASLLATGVGNWPGGPFPISVLSVIHRRVRERTDKSENENSSLSLCPLWLVLRPTPPNAAFKRSKRAFFSGNPTPSANSLWRAGWVDGWMHTGNCFTPNLPEQSSRVFLALVKKPV